MDKLQAARILRPGTSWVLRGNVLEQATGETPVTVPTTGELQVVIDADDAAVAAKIAEKAAKKLIFNDKNLNTKDRLDAVIEYLEIDL